MASAVHNSSSRTRASRNKREFERGVRIRSRDIDVLFALWRMRLLSTSQLTRLFFGAKGTCQKRMRKLFDTELVRVVVTDLDAENRYTITRLGHALLERIIEDEIVGPYRSPPRVDRRGLLHLDLLNDTRIALAIGAEQHNLQLAAFKSDWELRSLGSNAPIVPDAMVHLTHPDRAWQIALEIDTGSESSGVFGKKLGQYRRMADESQLVFGVKRPMILVVTLAERRARTLARQAVSVGVEQTVFADRQRIFADGGIASGLAISSDLVADPKHLKVEVFSRGLLRPEGIATR